MTVAIAICKTCNKEFSYLTSSSMGKYCSRKCYVKAVAIKKKNCLMCGKEYTPDKGNKEKWDKSKYCSMICLNKSKFNGSINVCGICGKEFYRSKDKFAKHKHHFCSAKCYNRYQVIKVTGNKWYRKGVRAEHECVHKLIDKGYITDRSAGSLGIFDVFGFRKDSVKLVQVKSTSKKKYTFPAKDLKKMIGIGVPELCSKELWVKYDRRGYHYFKLVDGKFVEYDFEVEE